MEAASAAYDLVLVAICKTVVAAVSRHDELLQRYFSVNKQCFTLTRNQHKLNFSETNRAKIFTGFYTKKKMILLENHLKLQQLCVSNVF